MTVDFSTMASASLPSLNGSGGRSAQMTFAPFIGAQTTTTSFSINNSNSNNPVDIARLQQLSHSLPASSPANKGTQQQQVRQAEEVNIEEMLERRRQKVLHDIFTNEMEATRRFCDKKYEDRTKKNWEQQKQTILKDTVGDRRLGGSAIVSSSNNDNKLSTLNSMMAPSMSATNFTKDHLSLITQYNANKSFPILTEMINLVNNRSPSYAAAWKLVATLNQGSNNNTPLSLAISTLSHLARQYQAHVANRVQAASLAGQIAPSAQHNAYRGMARTVATFVNLNLGSQTSFWAIVFYCKSIVQTVFTKTVVHSNSFYF